MPIQVNSDTEMMAVLLLALPGNAVCGFVLGFGAHDFILRHNLTQIYNAFMIIAALVAILQTIWLISICFPSRKK